MISLRLIVGLSTLAFAVLLAQSANETREKEAALQKNLWILRQALDNYTYDQHRAPQALQDLITKRYISAIPVDPMMGKKSTWCLVMEDPTWAMDRTAPGIFDVHSCSTARDSNGEPFSDW